jgi:ABC-2 type transport system ATP-binding protein
VISEVGLADKRRSWVVKLSGGQRQRLAVACALVGDPELLFLDEPTTGLDPNSRRQIWEIIRDLRRRGRTILLTTHYMDEAERLCDRVAVVDRGRVIAEGTPNELISSLKWEHVVEFSVNGTDGEDLRGDEGPDLASVLIDEIGVADLPTVLSARANGSGIQLSVGEPHVAIPALMKRLAERGRTLSSLTTRHASLEDVFVSLTGRHLDE